MLKYVLINLGIGLLNLGITAYRADKEVHDSEVAEYINDENSISGMNSDDIIEDKIKGMSDAGFLLLCWLFYSIPLINIVILACLVFCKGGKK